jgi:cell division protein FtsI (penicillin-binding protein 3)
LYIAVKLCVIRYGESGELLKTDKFYNQTSDIIIHGNRGDIYDAKGELLSTTIVYHNVYMDFGAECITDSRGAKDSLNKYLPGLAKHLSDLFKDKSAAGYEKSIRTAFKTKDRNFRLCPVRIMHKQYLEILDLPFFTYINKGKKRSTMFREALKKEEETDESERFYPFGDLAKQTIGNRRTKGNATQRLYGIEKEWNDSLRGKQGKGVNILFAGRRINRCYEGQEAENGYDIHTTIDSRMQDIADKALRRKLAELEAATGCLLLMKATTGELRAIVNLQRNAAGAYSEQVNMAFGDFVGGEEVAEPGSTFKVPVMVTLLESGRINLDTQVDVEGGVVRIANTTITDDKDHLFPNREHYYVKPEEVIVSSLNTGISKLLWKAYGEKSEISKFYEQLFKTGINTDIDFRVSINNLKDKYGNNRKPLLIPESNKPGDYLKMAYGYGSMRVPPVNMLMFYNAIANDGKMVKPYFIKSLNKDGKAVYEFETEVINPAVCSPKTLKAVQTMLEKVVSDEHGTAHRTAQSKAVKIAGKTGTAQIHNRQMERTGLQATFAGYFPIHGEMYSAIVVMRGKSERMYGSAAAAVIKEVAEKIYANETTLSLDSLKTDSNDLKVPSKNGNAAQLKRAASALGIDIKDRTGGEWVRTVAGDNVINVNEGCANPLDAVRGMGLTDAVYLLEKNNYKVKLDRNAYIGMVKEATLTGKTVLLTLN